MIVTKIDNEMKYLLISQDTLDSPAAEINEIIPLINYFWTQNQQIDNNTTNWSASNWSLLIHNNYMLLLNTLSDLSIEDLHILIASLSSSDPEI